MMWIQKTGSMLLLLLLLSGCARADAAPSEEGNEISIEALFQTESGDALQGCAACFSAGAIESYCQVDSDGTASVTGLPRDGELLLTLFDRQQEVQGIMTLLLERGAVIDAMTGEDGVGHITIRDDTSEVALMFVLTEDGDLRCTLWLTKTAPANTDLLRKGVSYGRFSSWSYQRGV